MIFLTKIQLKNLDETGVVILLLYFVHVIAYSFSFGMGLALFFVHEKSKNLNKFIEIPLKNKKKIIFSVKISIFLGQFNLGQSKNMGLDKRASIKAKCNNCFVLPLASATCQSDEHSLWQVQETQFQGHFRPCTFPIPILPSDKDSDFGSLSLCVYAIALRWGRYILRFDSLSNTHWSPQHRREREALTSESSLIHSSSSSPSSSIPQLL